MKNTEVIMTAKTVEEAMAAARAQYGSPDNELSFEILEMPKKGFLGIGAKEAKVKVTISRALEEVDLSGLVSELKSMKIATDRGGDDEKPARPREEQKKQKPQQKQQPKQNQPKQAQNQPRQQQNQPKARPQQEQKKPAPAEVKEIKAEAAAAKAEVKEIKAEAAAAKAEIKAEAAAAKPELDESNLPAALRRPVQKNQPQKNQKNQKKKPQPKPRDDRDGETKKKDLLSAVMGISDTKPATPSPAVTVTPTVMKPAPAKEEAAPEAAPAEEKSTSLSDAVDAALAAIEAETPAPLPEEAAAPDPREETRVEFITPAEMELALAFVNTLLADMKLEARAVAGEAREGEEGPEGTVVARVEIVGDDTGILIGHHGETLDAIQYLMNLSTSRKSGSGKREFVKILLDVGNYREKREETLRALARRTAARVVKYKRNIVLEPMNPYERRIIHSEIHNIPDVSTHSVGSDENRKIVITYEGADKPKDGGRRRGGDKNRRRGDRAERGEKPEKSEKSERSEKPRRDRGERPAKPVRAKSIDEVQIDLSGDSDKTFGSILLDEGVETEKDPIEEIAREDEAKEENLREY